MNARALLREIEVGVVVLRAESSHSGRSAIFGNPEEQPAIANIMAGGKF